MSERLFGTDGVRKNVGVYPITPDGAYDMARATAAHFDLTGEAVLVAGDTRASSAELREAAAAGFCDMGVEVHDMGVLPTPGLAWNVKNSAARAGMMVTASHNLHLQDNPREMWNGLKIVGANGDKLADAQEDEIQRLMEAGGAFLRAAGGIIHTASAGEFEDAYYKHLLSLADGQEVFSGLRLGIDMAHGATYRLAGKLARELGAREVVALGNSPDGWNINNGYGATHRTPLREAVRHKALDLGAAFDGDGDRIYLVESSDVLAEGLPREADGDTLAYMLATTGQHRRIALTQMTNGGVVAALHRNGTETVRTDVGDRYLLEAIRKSSTDPNGPITLGAEESGHIIDPQIGPTGDGMGVLVRSVAALKSSSTKIGNWITVVDNARLPLGKANVGVTNKQAAMADPSVRAAVEAAEAAMIACGGRVLFRPSGTGNEVRLLLEGNDEAAINEQLAHFRHAIAGYAL